MGKITRWRKRLRHDAANQHARRDHLVDREPRLREMLLQGRAIVRRVADAEGGERLAREPALFQVAACVCACSRGQRGLEELGRGLHQPVEPLALVLARFIARRQLGHGHAGLAG
jgi:hypothetical protein